MRHIGDSLKRTMDKSSDTERGELMQYFMQHLNRDRAKDGFPPMTMGRIGKMFEQIPTKDLYYLQSVCSKAPNFSKKFWWELKPKDEEKQKRK